MDGRTISQRQKDHPTEAGTISQRQVDRPWCTPLAISPTGLHPRGTTFHQELPGHLPIDRARRSWSVGENLKSAKFDNAGTQIGSNWSSSAS